MGELHLPADEMKAIDACFWSAIDSERRLFLGNGDAVAAPPSGDEPTADRPDSAPPAP